MSPVVAALLVGLMVGVIVGALGAGGGIMSVPILVYALGQSPHSAAASSLVIVGATAVAGSIHHLRNRTIDWGHGLAFGLLGAVGSFVASRASVRVDGTLLLMLFAVLLGLVAVAMFIKAASDRRSERAEPADPPTSPAPSGHLRWVRIFLLATLTGALTGFFGVGGGFILVPILLLVLRLPIRTAAGTSLLVMIIASAIGLASRIGTQVVIDWPVTLAFTAASMVGGLLGGPITKRTPNWLLTLVFATLLSVVSAAIGVQIGLARA